MGGLSLWPGVMAELAKGIRAFRSNLKDDQLPHGDRPDGTKGPSSES